MAGWLVVFYEEPPQHPSSGVQAAYGLRYHGTETPLSILVYFDDKAEVLEYHCDAGFPATIRAGTSNSSTWTSTLS
jgi:hypothetical protein